MLAKKLLERAFVMGSFPEKTNGPTVGEGLAFGYYQTGRGRRLRRPAKKEWKRTGCRGRQPLPIFARNCSAFARVVPPTQKGHPKVSLRWGVLTKKMPIIYLTIRHFIDAAMTKELLFNSSWVCHRSSAHMICPLSSKESVVANMSEKLL